MAKLIHSIKSNNFESTYPKWKESTDSSYYAICFTDDGYLYTHGKKFALNIENPDGTLDSFKLEIANKALTLTNGKYSASVDLPIIGVSNGTLINVELSPVDSAIYKINHADSGVTEGSYGSIEGTTDLTLNTPVLTIDKQGHITAAEVSSNIINHVLQTKDTTKSFLLGSSDATTGTRATKVTDKFYTNGSTLAGPQLEASTHVKAPKYFLGDVEISLKFITANGTSEGFVKLIDTYGTGNGVGQGIAATPKSVQAAYDAAVAAANAHSDSLIAANDAMVFKGTFDNNGLITGQADVNGKTITSLTNYTTGWTFKYNPSSNTQIFTFGSEKLEAGDMIIAIKENTSFVASDFTIIQANIDGAVTADNNLTGLLIGTGTRNISAGIALNSAAGTKYLTSASGKLQWTDLVDNNTWRPITVAGSKLLADASLTITNDAGSLLTLTADTSGNVTLGTDIKTFTIGGIAFNGSEDKTISVGNDLKKTANTALTITHANDITAVTTEKLAKFKFDGHGHITGTSDISKLTIKGSSGVNAISYDPNAAATLTIVGAAGTDCSISTSSENGKITITPSITHKYKNINGMSADTLTIKNGNSNVTVTNDTSKNTISISSVNTWRNVSAYMKVDNNPVITGILNDSISTADLAFGDEFLWTGSKANDEDGELKLVWAEVDDGGNITYKA